ncbi:MAG: thioredoxin family protein [Bacteroidota bacterium]
MNTTVEIPTPQELQNYLNKAMDFDTYFKQFNDATERVKNDDTEGLVYPEYYVINMQRLKRGVKTTKLSDELMAPINDLDQKITWLVITEFWCGDAAQSIGLLAKVAEAANGKIDLKFVFRDENPELMDAFLTNGGKSIPKVIQLNDNNEVISDWGPRPAPAQEIVVDLLAKKESYNDPLHAWYAKDRGVHMQEEIAELLRAWSKGHRA